MKRNTTLRALSLIGALAAAALAGCAPEPLSVACSNDAQCQAADEKLNYCLESHCVECVGITNCAEGEVCDNGACVQCINDRGCPSGKSCVEGACKAL